MLLPVGNTTTTHSVTMFLNLMRFHFFLIHKRTQFVTPTENRGLTDEYVTQGQDYIHSIKLKAVVSPATHYCAFFYNSKHSSNHYFVTLLIISSRHILGHYYVVLENRLILHPKFDGDIGLHESSHHLLCK